jgi:Zn-dependent peptidase ImmA (M78 family)/transcriptional regulator with XRE-family HTH domain
MPIDFPAIGKRLKEARVNCDLSQEEVAKGLKIPRVSVVQIENGERQVTIDQLGAFAKLFRRPLSEFFIEQPEEMLVAILRAAPELESRELIEAEIMRHVTICSRGAELEQLLDIPARTGPPAYSLLAPMNAGEAVEQGLHLARQERLRLGLGDNPIPDMADLISATGIWATGAVFPEILSGMFLRHRSIGMVILVNFRHARVRKRFSYAHEYAHALLDRDQTATISFERNRTDLLEVRANAFAAGFLLPSAGVRSFLRSRRKGLQSKLESVVYDPFIEHDDDEPVRAITRTVAGSQTIAYQDVASLAHLYGTSYQAAAYRLKGLGHINERDLKELLDKQAFGREYSKTLRFDKDNEDGVDNEKDPREGDRELIGQIVDLTIEAYRRGLLSRDRISELGNTLGIGGRRLVTLADAAK